MVGLLEVACVEGLEEGREVKEEVEGGESGGRRQVLGGPAEGW